MSYKTIVTAGSTYQDIDAYACCVALAELLVLQGTDAVAWSQAPRNYSVHPMLVESDLPNALLKDIKTIRDHRVLPPRMAQLCVWDGERILDRLPQIRALMAGPAPWMINVIGLRQRRSWFVCDDTHHQRMLAEVFGVGFAGGVAACDRAWLRKEIIRQTQRI